MLTYFTQPVDGQLSSLNKNCILQYAFVFLSKAMLSRQSIMVRNSVGETTDPCLTPQPIWRGTERQLFNSRRVCVPQLVKVAQIAIDTYYKELFQKNR